ncbi:MAG TPA: translation elongation factor Ts [Spirochaetia bacterium]|nr:translation elongation factor Ts [Spirochaetia bacterium]
MEIRAEDVRKLREKTGAGMMDCKKALGDADGDIAKAEKILKELGLAAAAKRSGRATNEGRVFTRIAGAKAAILELSCETDFVARNEKFVELGEALIGDVIARNPAADDAKLQEKVTEAVAVIKENMSLRRFDLLKVASDELTVQYLHGDAARIGVLVSVKADKPELLADEKVKEFAFDCALHVAAFSPMFLSEADVSEGYRKEQEEIFQVQAKNLGKPENVLPGIVKGKLKKLYSEICLLDQPFVKDDKRSVSKVAEDIGKAAGGKIAVSAFRYYRVGEELSE